MGYLSLLRSLMTPNSWIILCLAYIVGLLSTNLFNWQQLGEGITYGYLAIAILSGLVVIVGIFASGYSKPQLKLWLGAGIVAMLAVVYFQLRIPQPNIDDISYQVARGESRFVTVAGKVLTEPRLTANNKLKFWLQAARVNQQTEVSGKLYVTVPLLSATGIYPGQHIATKGVLYLPQPATNPGGFDFRAYLARQGTFAGLQGFEVAFKDNHEPVWGWWQLRRRIIRSHLQGLGSPVGQLISSMVLGRRAVDLSAEIREGFIEAGLAHILAASGFHVSLLLGIILKITNRLSSQSQLIIGIATLFTYIGLTGLQPSVLRAGLMGTAVLIAIAKETKVKPLGSLLLAATIILLVNPLWIGDVGFQLSFLATLGLIVTLPALQTKLDWLPPTIATLIAVPLAASVWVLPLLSYVFNTVATYSIITNIISTPLIAIISLGGMISAIAALIFPPLGSMLASLLFYPTLLLIEITKLITNLPGSSWAIGTISLGVLLIIYGLLSLVWFSKWWQQRWWLAGLFAITLIVVPMAYSKLNLLQVTVLAAKQEQIMVIQDRGKVILINSGKNNPAKYTVVPFLAQQGINQIDYAIALDERSNLAAAWQEINTRATIKSFTNSTNSLAELISHRTTIKPAKENIETESLKISIDSDLAMINLQIQGHTWLILGQSNNGDRHQQAITQYIEQHHLDTKPLILFWSGNHLASAWLSKLQLQKAIATKERIPQDTRKQLQQKQVEFYTIQQDGAIAWTPQTGFRTTLNTSENNNTF